ncbi:MAG: RNA polymerase sigma factor [Actinomycetota bacterium]
MVSASDLERFDERELVEAARHDAGAFAVLYRRYVDRIHAYAYRRSNSRAVAEDVTAATFEKALRNLHRFRWREPGIGPWLFRIASNELIDQHRREARQERTAERLQGEWVDEVAGADSTIPGVDHGELRRALDAISPRYQRALTLRYLADLSNEEAAQALGVSRATMAVVLHRATAALRKALANEGNGARETNGVRGEVA